MSRQFFWHFFCLSSNELLLAQCAPSDDVIMLVVKLKHTRRQILSDAVEAVGATVSNQFDWCRVVVTTFKHENVYNRIQDYIHTRRYYENVL